MKTDTRPVTPATIAAAYRACANVIELDREPGPIGDPLVTLISRLINESIRLGYLTDTAVRQAYDRARDTRVGLIRFLNELAQAVLDKAAREQVARNLQNSHSLN